MSKRTFYAVSFSALTLLGLAVTQSDAKPDEVKLITQGVWFREGDLMGKGHCNNIIIEMKDYLVVIDANFPSGAQAALADIKKISSKPVRYVFDTHHHGDHAYGNPVWSKIGATTLAHQGVVDEMKRYEPKRWTETSKQREDVGSLKLATAEPPKQTFSDKPFVIDDGNRKIEFHHFGWAHTRGDGFAYLPKEKIICTGDAATNGPYNYTADANIGNWPDVLGKAAKLDFKQVLPGHGPAGDRTVITGEIEFMMALRRAVRTQIQSGKTLKDLVTMKDGKPVATSLKLPDSVKNWVGPFLAAQVNDAFEELTMNKPHGDLPH
ncbi:MAG: MBL fold metallo-hydrolase [Candidatus Solibacter usitatus]|nr:MBL fold metallo-hydrolase [Candidatus Solibacter usitatus]